MKIKLCLLAIIAAQTIIILSLKVRYDRAMDACSVAQKGWEASIQMTERANKNTADAQKIARDSQAVCERLVATLKTITGQ